ncbi:MAG: hypothetical protein HDT15_02365 [Oscillibacter sp.]|nr:hypothetical protein [Oscillibacter sp.]MBD5153933.1 hypothetical protein [Oscillibacter sp.]MBD5168960.1 hypothetical protein [Oscillibacter sp.]
MTVQFSYKEGNLPIQTIIGASGELFALGAECNWNEENNGLKVKASALVGGGFSVGFE